VTDYRNPPNGIQLYPMHDTTVEQQARDMLERMGVEGAQSYSAGDLSELANLIASNIRMRRDILRFRIVTDPKVPDDDLRICDSNGRILGRITSL
jgi:hypothetical protein